MTTEAMRSSGTPGTLVADMHVWAPDSGSTWSRARHGPRRDRAPLCRILERERRLRRVLESEPEPLQQIDEKMAAESFSMRLADQSRLGLSRHYDALLAEHRILLANLSCNRISPYSSASGRGGQPETYTSTGTILSTPCSTL